MLDHLTVLREDLDDLAGDPGARRVHQLHHLDNRDDAVLADPSVIVYSAVTSSGLFSVSVTENFRCRGLPALPSTIAAISGALSQSSGGLASQAEGLQRTAKETADQVFERALAFIASKMKA